MKLSHRAGLVVLHSDGHLDRTLQLSAAVGVFCEFRLHAMPGPLVVSELRGKGIKVRSS